MKTIVLSYLTAAVLGAIAFTLFLVLKLCNLDNPDFEWLSWFWVFSPLWMTWVIENIVMGAFVVIGYLSGMGEK